MNTTTQLDTLLLGSGVVTREDSTSALLDQFGLNWKVTKEKLHLADGTDTPFFGIVREDTRDIFQTVKEGYQPYQNSDLLELVSRAAGNLGLSVDNGAPRLSGE